MLEHSSEVNVAESRRSSGRRARTDWRLGGRTVRRWREWLLAFALMSLGASVLIGALVDGLWDSSIAPVVATAVVMIGMIVPVVGALARSRPAGLLRFRLIDLLWGVGLGTALCLARGVLSGGGEFPAAPTIDGAPSTEWWVVEALGGVVIAPAVEELFFRGVILVSIFTLTRRAAGPVVAGVAAALVSTGLFTLLHVVTAEASIADVASVALLGVTASSVVVLTGRIWGAVLLHAVYNTAMVAIGLVGALVG